LDLICPKEQPCDNVPATRPLSEPTNQPPKQKEEETTPSRLRKYSQANPGKKYSFSLMLS
ncbi:hypothetical protein, partial [Escherichia coli]|uniref:hypothetical protein n=1 Tax=Escherichia coli TaxID=562 RepID=UPI002023EA6D